MRQKEILKTIGQVLFGLTFGSALCFGAGKGIFYYNYNLAPPAKLMKQIKNGQSYQEVYSLVLQYENKYKNDPDVSVSVGDTDLLTATALKIPKGKYIHIYHDSFADDLQLTIYFDTQGKVVDIEYVGD